MIGPLMIEAKQVGGRRAVADLSSTFASWTATTTVNGPGEFVGVLNDASMCGEALSKLEPWWTEIEITDRESGQVLWSGPVVDAPDVVSSGTESAEVKGATHMWWLQHRAPHDTINYEAPNGGPAAEYAAAVIRSGLRVADPNLVNYVTVHPGSQVINRKVEVSRSLVYDALSDMLGSAFDVWPWGRAIHVGPADMCFGHLGSFGVAIINGQWQTLRRGSQGSTRTIVRGGSGLILGDAGGPVVSDDGTLEVLVEELIWAHDDDATAGQRIAEGRVMQRAPLEFLNDAATGWLDCSSGLDIRNLSVGTCITLEIPTWNGLDVVQVDARISTVRWSYDGTEHRVGVQVSERSGVVV